MEKTERDKILAFLRDLRPDQFCTREQWDDVYQLLCGGSFGRYYAAWRNRLCTGHTYTMRAVAWYQYVYKPGSKDCRPTPIIAAILNTTKITERGEDHE